MKKYFIPVLLLAISMSSFAQATDNRTLFTVGGDKVTVSDFEYVYNKNNVNNQADYSEKSLRDYLALYENFRLKVREAEAMKLDTIASLKSELEGYRKQLAKSYLSDREITDKLISEAYERSKMEVNASHILVKVDENANPADTLIAYKKIVALRKRIEKGESFEQVARESSEDPSAKNNGGNIGWFSVFGTIYPFENACYTLKKGELSQPVRTEFGYHLVKVENTRAARGQVHVEHLMIRFPEKATPAQMEEAKHKIDSIYTLLTVNKMSFEDAVKNFSEDKGSRAKNGDLPWFGTGAQTRMMPEFEDAAFALQKDGDISAPVMTKLGWHILKRIEKKDPQPFSEVKNDIKKKVERDSRSEVAKTVLVDRIKKENGFMQFADVKAAFINHVDSGILKGGWHADSTLRSSKKVLFKLAGKSYTEGELAEFIGKTAKRRSDKSKEALLNEYYDNFVNTKCLDYEESNLEVKKPEFRNLMKEYKDGILLFELMDRMVWTKAVKDTDGLEAFRKKNAGKYQWGNRVDVAIYNLNDKTAAESAYKLVNQGKSADDIKGIINTAGSKAHVSVIEGKYEKGQYDVVDKIEWKQGVTPVKTINDSSYQFIQVKQIVGPEAKSLKEAKGYIVSDYQEYLEKSWLEALRNKYPIKLDESVFTSLVKNKK
jgi:peptidyl-prolyl cis-trans isomerase SurA